MVVLLSKMMGEKFENMEFPKAYIKEFKHGHRFQEG